MRHYLLRKIKSQVVYICRVYFRKRICLILNSIVRIARVYVRARVYNKLQAAGSIMHPAKLTFARLLRVKAPEFMIPQP